MSVLPGLLLGASWWLCIWLGYRSGYDNGRADAALDRMAAAVWSPPAHTGKPTTDTERR